MRKGGSFSGSALLLGNYNLLWWTGKEAIRQSLGLHIELGVEQKYERLLDKLRVIDDGKTI